MRRALLGALRRRSEGGSRILAEQMLSRESQRRRAKSEQRVVEFAEAGTLVWPGPIRAELLDHELAERVIQVSGIPGAPLRLAFRGQSIEIGILHEEPRRVLPRPSGSVHHDR